MRLSPVIIEKHQPERRRKAVTTLHCGCTCCCCCCLHTIGSVVGAAVAPAIGQGLGLGALTSMPYHYDEDTGRQLPLFRTPGLSAVTVFWWLLCFLIFLGFAGPVLLNPQSAGSTLLITGVVILMAFPLLQLVSAFITLIIFACWPRYDKFHQLKQLGKITAGIVLGSIAGIGVMVVIAAMFGAFR